MWPSSHDFLSTTNTEIAACMNINAANCIREATRIPAPELRTCTDMMVTRRTLNITERYNRRIESFRTDTMEFVFSEYDIFSSELEHIEKWRKSIRRRDGRSWFLTSVDSKERPERPSIIMQATDNCQRFPY